MGIIKAVKQAIGGGFADTWQEVIEPDNIGDQTVYARGGGGGRPNMAQAGGKNPAGIPDAIASVKDALSGMIK